MQAGSSVSGRQLTISKSIGAKIGFNTHHLTSKL